MPIYRTGMAVLKQAPVSGFTRAPAGHWHVPVPLATCPAGQPAGVPAAAGTQAE
jgi:hypothetical protein